MSLTLKERAVVAMIKASRHPARVLGFLSYLGDGRRRRVMAEEYRKIMPEADDATISGYIRGSYVQHFHRYFDNFFMQSMTSGVVGELVSIEGRENLDEALARGKGAILLLSHFGSNIMNAISVAFAGYKVSQLAAPPTGGRLLKFLFRRKSRLNEERLPLKFLRLDESIVSVVKTLKRNEVMSIAFDGRHGGKLTQIKMFGRDAFVAHGVVKMALMTGATIVPTFIIRQPDNTQRVVLETCFEITAEATEQETIQANLQRLSEVFERYILEHPDHYGIALASMKIRERLGLIERTLIS